MWPIITHEWSKNTRDNDTNAQRLDIIGHRARLAVNVQWKPYASLRFKLTHLCCAVARPGGFLFYS